MNPDVIADVQGGLHIGPGQAQAALSRPFWAQVTFGPDSQGFYSWVEQRWNDATVNAFVPLEGGRVGYCATDPAAPGGLPLNPAKDVNGEPLTVGRYVLLSRADYYPAYDWSYAPTPLGVGGTSGTLDITLVKNTVTRILQQVLWQIVGPGGFEICAPMFWCYARLTLPTTPISNLQLPPGTMNNAPPVVILVPTQPTTIRSIDPTSPSGLVPVGPRIVPGFVLPGTFPVTFSHNDPTGLTPPSLVLKNPLALPVTVQPGSGFFLIEDQDDQCWYFLDTNTPGPGTGLAGLNLPNTFTVGPQTVVSDADAHACLVLRQHSATTSADQLQYQTSAGAPLIGFSQYGSVRVYDSLTMSGFQAGTFTGLADGATYTDCAFATNMELRGGSWSLFNNSLWGAFNQLDSSSTNGDAQFYMAPPQANPASTFYLVGYISGQDRGVGVNVDVAPTNPYRTFGALTAYCYAASQKGLWVTGAAGQTAPLVQLRGVDASAVETNLVDLDAVYADSTDATYKGRLVVRLWDFNGAGRVLLQAASDGTNAKIEKFGQLATKGDLLVYDGTYYQKLAVGSDTQVLTANSAASVGVDWETPASNAGSIRQYVSKLSGRRYFAAHPQGALIGSANCPATDLIALPYWAARSLTLDLVCFGINSLTVATNFRLGIYSNNALNDPYPVTNLWDSGSINVNATGEYTANPALTLSQNTLYWFTIVRQGGTLGVAGFDMGSQTLGNQNQGGFPLLGWLNTDLASPSGRMPAIGWVIPAWGFGALPATFPNQAAPHTGTSYYDGAYTSVSFPAIGFHTSN